jgi:6-phosphogluconolactonase (cycloisomerase 2 family)
MEGMLPPEPGGDAEPLLAYVGTLCYPRSFNSDPTGRFLSCCNKRGDNVAVFRVDRKAGGPAFTGHYVPVGDPSSIAFLDRKKRDWRRGSPPGSFLAVRVP